MSLILRKTCQPLLDNAGLANYHVDIHNEKYGGQKNMVIVGECGQPFIRLNGVSFAKLAPTRAEIEYASELLVDFLGTHKLKIDAYLKKLSEFKRMKEVPLDRDGMKILRSVRFCNDNNNSKNGGVLYADFPFIITVGRNDNIVDVSFKVPKTPFTIKEAIEHDFDVDKFQAAVDYRNAYYEWLEAESEVDRLKGELSSCEI